MHTKYLNILHTDYIYPYTVNYVLLKKKIVCIYLFRVTLNLTKKLTITFNFDNQCIYNIILLNK